MLLTPCRVDFVTTLLYHLEALRLSFFSFFLSSPPLARDTIPPEEARDFTFDTSKDVAALVNSYLARAYASAGDGLRFQCAIDRAETLMSRLKLDTDHNTNHVFYSLSGVMAELSYG